MACLSGDPDKINYLISIGADLESRTIGWQTPLMFAAMSGSLHAVKECLNSAMNPF